MRAASMYSVSQMIVKNCSTWRIDVILDETNIKSLVSLKLIFWLKWYIIIGTVFPL